MPIFVLFVSAGVLFDGTFSLWVSLISKNIIFSLRRFLMLLLFFVIHFRVQAGHCFHLFTNYHNEQLVEYQLPEMLRTPLESLCLQIKVLICSQLFWDIGKCLVWWLIVVLALKVKCLLWWPEQCSYTEDYSV